MSLIEIFCAITLKLFQANLFPNGAKYIEHIREINNPNNENNINGLINVILEAPEVFITTSSASELSLLNAITAANNIAVGMVNTKKDGKKNKNTSNNNKTSMFLVNINSAISNVLSKNRRKIKKIFVNIKYGTISLII
jgi:hypothetical protein